MPSNHVILCHPLSSCFHSIPASRSFLVSQFFVYRWPKYWSFSFSISPPMNIHNWFPLGLTCLISLQSKGISRVFSNTTVQKHQFFSGPFFMVQFLHPCMSTGKTIAFSKIMSLLFNMLSRFVIAFLPRTLHMDITRWSTPKSDWLYYLQPKMEKL